MYDNKKRPAPSQNEPMVFRYSEASKDLQTVLHENEPWIVAKDLCSILGLGNVTKALYVLESDEKLTLPIVRSGQNRNVNLVNESGMYALIFQSRKTEAKAFRKWVTSEVLPSIRKKGYYAMHQPKDNFIDARNIPYMQVLINEQPVRVIELEETKWFSINDYHTAINSRTNASQTAKKLNAKEQLAVKIQLFGNTQPAWFTKELGLKLIASGSRIMKSNQLSLSL